MNYTSLRNKMGLSQEELGKELFVNQEQVKQMEVSNDKEFKNLKMKMLIIALDKEIITGQVYAKEMINLIEA